MYAYILQGRVSDIVRRLYGQVSYMDRCFICTGVLY